MNQHLASISKGGSYEKWVGMTGLNAQQMRHVESELFGKALSPDEAANLQPDELCQLRDVMFALWAIGRGLVITSPVEMQLRATHAPGLSPAKDSQLEAAYFLLLENTPSKHGEVSDDIAVWAAWKQYTQL